MAHDAAEHGPRFDPFHHDRLDRIERELGVLAHEVHQLIHQGDRLMALVDDLQTALNDVGTKVEALAAPIDALTTEVKDLLAKLQTGGNVTPAMVSQAQGISSRLDAISSAISAIPPETP